MALARAFLVEEYADHDALDVLARLDRWLPDLVDGLDAVYDEPELLQRVVDLALRAHLERPERLRAHDRQRVLRPDWFQLPSCIGYAAYVDRFAGDLQGVRDRVPYLAELGVTYLHLMPLLQPRPAPNDGGYAVADYRAVRPDLGTMADLAELADTLHEQGMALTLDLVLNHVAREHEWARHARAGEERYRRYFRMFPDRTGPDAYEATLPEVFPATAPGSFTWDDEAAAWVWTTFNTWQWDLDWSNPDVFCEFVDIVLFLANQGVDCLRLDAIAFLWKRLGTNSQNQPEVHAITQALRAVARIAAPSLVFKAEAIVGPDQLMAYLGAGEHAGKVSDVAYHNSLMVQIWSALAARDARLMVRALRRFPPKPTTAAWGTYLRCHDDIGWAIDDVDTAGLGWTGAGHRSFLSDFYSGEAPGSFARGAVFQHNEETGDRRISGSAASLAGVEAALEDQDDSALDAGTGPARVRARDGVRVRGDPARLHGRRAGAAQRPYATSTPRSTPTTTGGCTGPRCRGRWPSSATTRRRWPGGRSPRCSTWRGPAPGSRRCTRRWRPSCSRPATKPSSWPYVGTLPGRWSRSSTSPSGSNGCLQAPSRHTCRGLGSTRCLRPRSRRWTAPWSCRPTPRGG